MCINEGNRIVTVAEQGDWTYMDFAAGKTPLPSPNLAWNTYGTGIESIGVDVRGLGDPACGALPGVSLVPRVQARAPGQLGALLLDRPDDQRLGRPHDARLSAL